MSDSEAAVLQTLLRARGGQWHQFTDRESLSQVLCRDICQTLEQGISERAQASLVLPGGTTPQRLLALLAERAVDWSRVTLSLSDERWVPVDSPDSNEAQLRRLLLSKLSPAPTFVALKAPGQSASPSDDAALANSALAALPRFDCVVLGMGSDGHCASLFPGSPDIAAALDIAAAKDCMVINRGQGNGPRLSLSLRRLLNCRTLVLHIQGEEKRRVLAQALGGQTEMPVAALFGRDVAVQVYWAP